jgi:hypothetical protein
MGRSQVVFNYIIAFGMEFKVIEFLVMALAAPLRIWFRELHLADAEVVATPTMTTLAGNNRPV